MANKQIKDFGAITDGTGTSILVQNNTTDTYNKISAENIAAAATTLSKAITAQENVTIQKQLILDLETVINVPPPFLVKSTGANLNNTTAGIIEFDFTSDTNYTGTWGIKIKDGSDAWGIKAGGDAILENLEANTLEIEANFSTSPSPIKFTGDTILTYANSTAAASAGVPVGGIWVDNTGKMNVRLI